jgi:hypothetical protein
VSIWEYEEKTFPNLKTQFKPNFKNLISFQKINKKSFNELSIWFYFLVTVLGFGTYDLLLRVVGSSF